MTERTGLPHPLVEVAVEPQRKADRERFALALAELAARDSSFQVSTDRESGQTVVGGTSESHLDEKFGLVRNGYGIDCFFGLPQVSYRGRSPAASCRTTRSRGGPMPACSPRG